MDSSARRLRVMVNMGDQLDTVNLFELEVSLPNRPSEEIFA